MSELNASGLNAGMISPVTPQVKIQDAPLNFSTPLVNKFPQIGKDYFYGSSPEELSKTPQEIVTAIKNIPPNVMNYVQSKIYHDIRNEFSAKVQEFLECEFHNLADMFFTAKLNSQMRDSTSLLDSTQVLNGTSSEPQAFFGVKEKYADFITKYENFLDMNRKLSVDMKTVTQSIAHVQDNIKNAEKLLSDLQINTDEGLARRLHEEDKHSSIPKNNVTRQIESLQREASELKIKVDSIEQQGRKETLEIHGIPVEGSIKQEDCYQVVLGFLAYHFNIRLQKLDISVCHRQTIPSEKKRLGRQYIPLIYCKFVNRFRARDIVKKYNQLKNPLNKFGKPFKVCENLSFERREIWESVLDNLESYPIKWVDNGKIFLKKANQAALYSLPIKWPLVRSWNLKGLIP